MRAYALHGWLRDLLTLIFGFVIGGFIAADVTRRTGKPAPFVYILSLAIGAGLLSVVAMVALHLLGIAE